MEIGFGRFLVTVMLFFLVGRCSFADNLRDILHSDTLHAVRQDTVLVKARAQKALSNTDSNYSKLFAPGSKGPEKIADWLGVVRAGGFKPERVLYYKGPEHISVKIHYKAPIAKEIAVTVLVPRPEKLLSSQMKLIEEFRKLEPPDSMIEHRSDIDAGGIEGKLLHLVGGGCAIFINLSKGGVASLRANICYTAEELQTLTTYMNFRRLSDKLDS